MADRTEKIRQPDTTHLWSGELNADVAAAEAPTLSPAAIEETCKAPTDWEQVDQKKVDKEKEKMPKREEDVDQSTKVGCVDKLKDLITGPKPKQDHHVDSSGSSIQRGVHMGPIASPSLSAPALAGRLVGTHDFECKMEKDENKLVAHPKAEGAVHGGLGSEEAIHTSGSPKKGGVVSKVMHKLHLGV